MFVRFTCNELIKMSIELKSNSDSNFYKLKLSPIITRLVQEIGTAQRKFCDSNKGQCASFICRMFEGQANVNIA